MQEDGPLIASLTLYRPRHPLLRLDVLPFACGYALAAGAYLGSPSLEVGANVVAPLLVCVHLLVFLVCHWSLLARCALKLQRVRTIARASLVHVTPTAGSAGLATAPSELCPLLRRPVVPSTSSTSSAAAASPGRTGDEPREEVRFEFHKTVFSLAPPRSGGGGGDEAGAVAAGDDASFVQLRMPVGEELAFYVQARGYRDAPSVAAAEYVHGANACHIPERSFLELFKEHALAPFFVFQVVCVLLWSLDDYWYYSLFTLVMLVVFEATVVKSRQRNTEEMRAYSAPASRVCALRAGKWEELSSEALLPGDLISIARAPPIFGEPVETLVPADVLLLHGAAVVNESALTGESTPQRKESLESLGLAPTTRLDLRAHRACVLLSGTKLLQHTAGAQSRALQPPQPSAALGYVVRTGFQSSQGKLMRTILFSSQRATGNTKEVFVFILFLLVFALAAAAHVLHVGLQDATRSRFKLVLHCCMIVTSVVPPELPMEISLAVNHSLLALHRIGIYCTEPFRIPFAGRLRSCCFDKTGTLTSDDMVVQGVAAVPRPGAAAGGGGGDGGDGGEGGERDAVLSSELVRALEVPEATSLVLAGCQQLVLVDGQLLGDPMERAAMQAVGWQFASEGVCVCRLPGRRTSLRVLQRFPFSSELKRSSTVVAVERRDAPGGGGGFLRELLGGDAEQKQQPQQQPQQPPQHGLTVLCKGAPETIRPLLREVPPGYDDAYMHHTRLGRRVLALASKPLPADADSSAARAMRRAEAESDLNFGGFLVLHCPAKPESAEVLAALRHASHELQMITGDQLLTACQAASELGLVSRPVLLLAPPSAQSGGDGGGGDDNDNESNLLARLTWQHWQPELGEARAAGKAAGKVGKAVGSAKGGGAAGTGLTRRKGAAADAAAAAAATAASAAAVSEPPPPFEPSAASFRLLGTRYDLCVSGDGFGALAAAGLLRGAVPHLRVMARMKPEQKQAALAALRSEGIPALMCGDGTNDVGALKVSDVGVALVSASLVAPPPPPRARPDDDDGEGGASGARARKAGKGGRGSERADGAEAAQQLEAPMLKLGDASIAAAFTARSASVTSCVDVILQGRCTLVTTIQMFKILALNCLVSAYGLSVLYLRGVRMGDTQATATGIATALFFLFVSSSRPLQKLSPRRPPSSVLAPYVFSSILAQFGVHLGVLVQASQLGAKYDQGPPPEVDGDFEPSVPNTVIWLISAAMMVTTFSVNYKGKPYMEGLAANKGLLITLGLSALTVALITSGVLPELAEYLELVPLAADECALAHAAPARLSSANFAARPVCVAGCAPT